MADQQPPPQPPTMEVLVQHMARVILEQEQREVQIVNTLGAMQQLIQHQGGQDNRDNQRRDNLQQDKVDSDFMTHCPKFERGKDRWSDFAARFRMQKNARRVSERGAKEALWNAITGKSSRIVVASMLPNVEPQAMMNFEQYLTTMGGKFTPASESMQMKSEYKSRVQGKHEDVQNYINEKHELFRMAYEAANDLSDFYMEVTKGIINKAVRSQMWGYQATSVEDYGQRAVHQVQVERQRIAFGDSDSSNMDGLVPVTKMGLKTDSRGEPMEVDSLRKLKRVEEEEEEEDSDCECVALHEQGFRGLCYYCQKKGHIARSCPRKSAGLSKITNQNVQKKGTYPPKKVWKGNATWKDKNRKPNFSVKKRVYAIQEEDGEADDTEEEGAEGDEEQEEVQEGVDFLENLTL